MKPVSGDEGSATLTGCCAVGVLVLVTVALLHIGSAVAVRHRAQSSADLSALAAAAAVDYGDEAACAAAEGIASRMDTAVDSCDVKGWDVVVTVRAPVMLSSLGIRDAVAIARAGPDE